MIKEPKNIGLLDIDSKNYPNFALMKIANYHKSVGDNVEWLNNFLNYDIVYKSKIFKFTKENSFVINSTEIYEGGTGYNLQKLLPLEIENSQPDYSIYNYDFSIQFFSRGCIRKCKFCVVPEKEGKITPITPVNLNPKGSRIEVLDNNFFANPEWMQSINYLLEKKQPVNLHGVDVRFMNEKHIYYLNKLKHFKQIKIAWDNPNQDLTKKFKEIFKHIKPYKLMCYVLIGYDSTPEQDLFRVEKLREFKISPFVMPFNKFDDYQKKFAQWVNRKEIFKTVSFSDFIYNKSKSKIKEPGKLFING